MSPIPERSAGILPFRIERDGMPVDLFHSAMVLDSRVRWTFSKSVVEADETERAAVIWGSNLVAGQGTGVPLGSVPPMKTTLFRDDDATHPPRNGQLPGRACRTDLDVEPRGDDLVASAEDDLASLITRAITRLEGVGDEFVPSSAHLAELGDRLDEGRFHLAVLGQFKRGKSTLLNTLLGQAILPTAVVPLTAIPTFIRPGDRPRARIHYKDERRSADDFDAEEGADLQTFLNAYVTEQGNPGNGRGVAHVEVFHPAPILREGVVLIDTPGIGSTFRHNTEATLNFLPQCDAAVFLVSADPPVTEVEVKFLKQVRQRVAHLFFLMNKVDYLTTEERDAALQFFRDVLSEHVGVSRDAPLFGISARNGLHARRAHDAAAWEASGLEAVQAHLLEFLVREKTKALRAAISGKVGAVLDDAILRIRLAVRSLQMPLEQLQGRLESFECAIRDIDRERGVAGDLLMGERRRMHRFLEDQAEELRSKARAHLRGIVEESLAGADPGRLDEASLKRCLAEVIPDLFEHELGVTTALFGTRMAEALRPHQQRADVLIEGVRRTAAELFDIPHHAPDGATAYELVREPFWVTRSWSTSISPIPEGLVDRLLPRSARRSRIERRLMAQVESLVIRNVENLRWETYQSLDRAFDRFGNELDRRLAETIAATRGAIREALDRRRRQSETVTDEVMRLEAVAAELGEIRDRLRSRVPSRSLNEDRTMIGPVPERDDL